MEEGEDVRKRRDMKMRSNYTLCHLTDIVDVAITYKRKRKLGRDVGDNLLTRFIPVKFESWKIEKAEYVGGSYCERHNRQ